MSAAAADPKGTTGTTDEDYDVLELCRAVVDAADAEKCVDVAEIVRSQQRREKRRRTALQEVCVVRRS